MVLTAEYWSVPPPKPMVPEAPKASALPKVSTPPVIVVPPPPLTVSGATCIVDMSPAPSSTNAAPRVSFPLPLMREFEREGRFKLAPRFHGAPTNRSQRVTLETDAPEILARCRQDQVDAALLVPT